MTSPNENTTAAPASVDDAATTANFHLAPDVALMRRVGQGDGAAQQELAYRLVMRVRRAAHALLPGSVDADDAAQHALIEILRSAHLYRGTITIERWADRVSGRSLIRFARAVRRRNAAAAPEIDGATRQIVRDERRPRNLDDVLGRLSQASRDALLLRHVFDLSIEEIAELTQVSPQTVRDRVLVARRELRRLAGPARARPSRGGVVQ